MLCAWIAAYVGLLLIDIYLYNLCLFLLSAFQYNWSCSGVQRTFVFVGALTSVLFNGLPDSLLLHHNAVYELRVNAQGTAKEKENR